LNFKIHYEFGTLIVQTNLKYIRNISKNNNHAIFLLHIFFVTLTDKKYGRTTQHKSIKTTIKYKFMANILLITPYEKLFPPTNGKQIRSFHLLNELSKKHDLHLIINQPESELMSASHGFSFPANVHIYSPSKTPAPATFFDHIPGQVGSILKYRWNIRSLNSPVDLKFIDMHHLIQEVLTNNKIDIVLLEHISSVIATVPLIKRYAPDAIRIIDAHNIDTYLLKQEMVSFGDDMSRYMKHKEYYLSIKWYESHLAKFVHHFLVCSNDDLQKIMDLNNSKLEGFIIPNGIDTSRCIFDDQTDKFESDEIIFCGSLDHIPNCEGLFWFIRNIFPLLAEPFPLLRLLIIGHGGNSPKFDVLRNSPRIEFIGEVNDVIPYYKRSSVAIAPLRIGSGTRIKILEAMSLGNPVVSTSIGAEGLDCVDNENIMIADTPEEFANRIKELLTEKNKFTAIQKAARQLVELKYDWSIIGNQLNQILEQIIR